MYSPYSLNPEFDTSDWGPFINSLPEILRKLPQSSRILGGRNDVYRLNHAGCEVAVKRFLNRGLWKKVVYRIVSSKAKRSFSHSIALNEAGLVSPQPVAWREEWGRLWLKESHYVCAYQHFEHDASALLEDDCLDREKKIRLLGTSIARMHDAELLHLDINQGNWLFSKKEDGSWGLSLVDNNRLKKGVVSLRRGVQCLLQLNFESAERNRLLNAYAEGRDADASDCQAILDRSRRRFELKWKIKNATRPWRRKIGL